MPELSRTLVKSVPELWPKISDTEALRGGLEAFGTVKVTRTQAEELVLWEGELASGSIRLEPSGFGTRVTLAVEIAEDAAPEAGGDARPTFWGRLLRRAPSEAPAPAGEPRIAEDEASAALSALLDSLGFANHRPFSRA